MSKKIFTVFLVIILCFSSIVPVFAASKSPVKYTYVLVHGMGGWGESDTLSKDIMPYWGTASGSLSKHLRSKGYNVKEADVGPFSSAWDRACELYAQLTGTKVDYGAAHSKAHGHSRYGRTYSTPLVKGWGTKTKDGQVNKINLIGHSFGGNTAALLVSLLEYGDSSEVKASGKNCSPLFKGGKGHYVNSVMTLCTPHNGSSLHTMVGTEKLVETGLDLIYALGGISKNSNGKYIDFQLEHFGIKSNKKDTIKLINKKFSQGKDNVFYDLSPAGAQELNKKIKMSKNVYYFSFAFDATEQKKNSVQRVPIEHATMNILEPIAKAMGKYTNSKSKVKINSSWFANDGLVNVISARYPFDEKYKIFNGPKTIERGCWIVYPTLIGDHATIIGMNKNQTNFVRNFYIERFKFIDKLPRIK